MAAPEATRAGPRSQLTSGPTLNINVLSAQSLEMILLLHREGKKQLLLPNTLQFHIYGFTVYKALPVLQQLGLIAAQGTPGRAPFFICINEAEWPPDLPRPWLGWSWNEIPCLAS